MGRVAPAVTSCGKSTVIKVLSVWAAEVGKKKKKKKVDKSMVVGTGSY